ncbi:MAG: hypothetical protein ACFFD4_16815 [Candidatus Odinarchaeota archaeon]
MTKIKFLFLIWILSAVCALSGSAFISVAYVAAGTPYDVTENPLIEEIWTTGLGDFRSYAIPNATGYRVFGDIVPSGEYFIANETGARNRTIDLPIIYIEMQNGTVSHDRVAGKVTFYFYNGTVYEVRSPQDTVWIDLNKKQFRLLYRQSSEQILIREEVVGGKVIVDKIPYFLVSYRSSLDTVVQIVYRVFDSFPLVFINVGMGKFLIFVIIGGGTAMITAFFFMGLRISRMAGGKRFSYFLLKLLKGRFGRVLNRVPFFDFSGDWFIEESFVDVIDLSTIRSASTELFKDRWYDILLFPTLFASIMVNLFLAGFTFEQKETALFITPLFAPVVLIILAFYYPAVWGFDEGGIKKIELGPQGDIISVKSLGNIIRDGLGILIGFSGIISVASFGVDVVRSFAYDQVVKGNIGFAGLTFDWFGFLLLVLITVGLFLIILSSCLVGVTMIALNYLETTHLENIMNLRKRSGQEKLISNFGSLYYRFNPQAKEIVVSKE